MCRMVYTIAYTIQFIRGGTGNRICKTQVLVLKFWCTRLHGCMPLGLLGI